MNRRGFLAAAATRTLAADYRKPNILFVLLDDLGYGDLGCYGQRQIRTPAIDRLAEQGRRYVNAYAGAPVCAPSRCVLMTGLHGGHARIRANAGTAPIGANDRTFADWLHERGYVCGGFGKWGLGDAESEGVPWRHGFDEFFGYLHQVHAHSYFPEFLWDNDRKVSTGGKEYSASLIADRSYDFLRKNKDKPFFLYAAFTLPHGRYETPTVEPYANENWPEGEKKYAAMVSQGDAYTGRLLEMLREFGLERDTLVIFASDNGGVGGEGHSLSFFDTQQQMRGQKGTLYEGGLRVPLLLRWPGRIEAGEVSRTPVTFADIGATILDAVEGKTLRWGDGVSLLRKVPQERPLVWESHTWNQQTKQLRPDFGIAVRYGKWKAVRPKPDAPVEVYNLISDPGEKENVALSNPAITKKLTALMTTEHTEPKVHAGDMKFRI